MSLTFGSLFAGIGGFDLGFERAGIVCKWQVEIDERCQQVLARHWPDVPQFGDVKDVGRKQLEPVSVICGGFPCQDVSVAGRREGLAGERSGLWFEFLRVIEELEPEWVVVENVPGLLSSNGGRDMATIVGGLAELRYWWAYRVIDLQWFGVPQRRRRVFIVASLTRGRPQQVLFERESSPWDTAPGREAGKEVAASIKSSPPNRRNGGSEPIAGEFVIDARNMLVGDKDLSLQAHHQSYSLNAMPLVAFGGNNTAGPIDVAAARNAPGIGIGGSELSYALRSNPSHSGDKGDGGINTTFVIGFSADRDGADAANELMPTLRHGGDEEHHHRAFRKPAIANHYGVRRLTPVECERLQGFPDGHTDGQSDSARYRQLGNAVGVPHSEWIGKRIAEVTP